MRKFSKSVAKNTGRRRRRRSGGGEEWGWEGSGRHA